MPTYQYQASSERSCDHCRDGFEEVQKMADPPLETCPRCGAPVRRVVSRVFVGKGNILSSANLRDKGFTRLRKVDKGVYERD